MVSGALGSAVFSAVTGVLLTRRYPLVVEGVRCSARSQRIITDDRLASGGRMVHHSIAVVITSCLTNFLERRLGEVRTGEVVLGVHRGWEVTLGTPPLPSLPRKTTSTVSESGKCASAW